MRKKCEVLELRATAVNRRRELLAMVEKEKRNLTADEARELEEIRSNVALYEAELDEIEEAEKQLRNKVRVGKSYEVSNPITQLLRGAVAGNLTEEQRELNSRGLEQHKRTALDISQRAIYIPLEELRGLTAGTPGSTGTIATEVAQIHDPLRDELVVVRAGAEYLTGLVGNLDVPTYSGTTSAWEGEVAQAKDGSGRFTKKTFSPKRLATVVPVSAQLLTQDSAGVEAMLRRDIVASIKDKLEQTIFGKGAGSQTEPKGLFNGTISNKGEASYDRLVDMATAMQKAKALRGRVAYVTNPVGEGILRKTLVTASGMQGFLLGQDGKTANSYDLYTTNAVATGLNTSEEGIIIANWLDFLLCQWGALEVKVDDVTQFDSGIIRFMVNSYWDFGFRNDDSYSVASIKQAQATVTA